MKLIITLVCVFVPLVSSINIEKVPKLLQESWNLITKPYEAKCVAETGVNQVYADRIFLYSEYPDDDALKCYMLCVCKELGIFNVSTGEWIVDAFLRVAGMTPEIYAVCNDETKAITNLCQKTFDLSKCFASHVREP
ncbi:hypothetical protein PPYR_11037 [Photinus pyralis]|uniref:Uncharacterized protein n=1 Tax=Photinus pyralis TaxID=7054 RepID=A0A1Y1L602_PHOPY|nr:uncharacterized protein LOC116174126 [Photinus pyralis]KAB0796976.1 hypothetical protein PPYR_11037 [Photinus pyralis]